ncbi:hypothetical protein MHBO_001914 [Bonamia ostreae]|uniref:Protein kinase domain-containing protein n=1 Tax=Bonamia ostreae TaxID=126728 RepID=A0ABV2AKL3_9EUKA
MAPECFETRDGKVAISRGADVWSLGIILFEMLVGHTPFSDLKGFAKCNAIVSEAAMPLHLIKDPLVLDLVKMFLQYSKKGVCVDRLKNAPPRSKF